MKKKNLIRFFKIVIKKKIFNIIVAFSIIMIVSILNLCLPQITKNILDNAIKNSNTNMLFKLIGLYTIISLTSSFLSIALEYMYSKMKNKISITFKIKIIKHLSKLSGNYYTNIKTGNILNILEDDIHVIEGLGAELIFSIIVDFFTALVSFIILMKMQSDLLSIIILLQILIMYSQSKFTRLIAKKSDEIRVCAGEVANINQEYVSNIMNIIISKTNIKFFRQYLKKERNMINARMVMDRLFSMSRATGNVFSSFISIIIYGYGGYNIIKGDMSFGELIAFQQYIGMLISPCMNIIRSNISIQQAKTSINHIFTILDEPINISNNNCGIRCMKSFKGDIIFDNVTFSYDNKCNIIKNMNLSFENGKITALVGSSGCGKSTITKLLFRLWDVENGEITVDRIPIKEYNLKDIRKNISIITQDLLLFDDTIINNIKPYNKSIDKELLLRVCKSTGINEFIDSLPNGFNTIVGEKGIKLSGGQKQRISIARSLLSDSKIIVFDEATSALDNISQNIVLENIKEFLIDKTVIVIAHRLSTIKKSDKIYVIYEGRVVEEGSHEELISNKYIYHNLINEKSLEGFFA